jgi:hypothetical protein
MQVVIPRTDLEPHLDLMYFVNDNLGVRWMGPGRHLMTYPNRGGQASFYVLANYVVNLTTQLIAL